jgi:predicted DNA-binding ribbon-helix-helix protein
MPRKLIEFHAEDLRALTELAEDRSTTLQELIDEAVRDLLKKHGKPTDLKTALRVSTKQTRGS